MFSAFDGTHEFAVTPSVPSASQQTMDSDPVMASSIRWEIDAAFVKREDFPQLPAAVKLITKRAGRTTVGISAKTLRGVALHSRAELVISQAKEDEWAAGEERYTRGEPLSWPFPEAAAHGGDCKLPDGVELPKTTACADCHTPTTSTILDYEYTPTQTAGYSNDDLVSIFSTAVKPAGNVYNSPFLRAAHDSTALDEQ